MTYTDDKHWSDRFIPEICSLIAPSIIRPAPAEDDIERCTDLIVLKLDAVRIACRVRRYRFLAQYGDEFTIRRSRSSGVKTELEKIISGWGNLMFYGFSNSEETKIARWTLIDLSVFRLWIAKYMRHHGGMVPGAQKGNVDGGSTFLSLKYTDIDPTGDRGLILSRSKNS